MTTHYEHSGKTPITGLTLAALCGIGTAVVLGVAYSYAVVFIPIVYLNVLLTACFGGAIGAAVSWAAKFGHVRSRLLPTVVGLLCGLVGLYVAWGADFLARIGMPNDGDFLIAFRPDVLKAYIRFFYENGFWGIGHGVGGNNNNQQMVSGIFLAAVWLGEAAIILGAATLVPWHQLHNSVYCEHCERWVKSIKGVQTLSLGAPDSALARITAGDLAPFETWPRAKSADQGFIRLNLDCCNDCSKSNYLSVERVITQFDKKGKATQVATVLVNRLAIDAADVARVRQAGQPAPVEEAAPAAEPEAATE
jgi:hypothetical protein